MGIEGVIPGDEGEDDIRLGDVAVSKPTSTFGGVVQYAEGKAKDGDKELRRWAVQQLIVSREANPASSTFTLSAFAVGLSVAEPFALQGPATLEAVKKILRELPDSVRQYFRVNLL